MANMAQHVHFFDKLQEFGILRRGDRLVGPNENGEIALDIRGSFIVMNSDALLALINTFKRDFSSYETCLFWKNEASTPCGKCNICIEASEDLG